MIGRGAKTRLFAVLLLVLAALNVPKHTVLAFQRTPPTTTTTLHIQSLSSSKHLNRFPYQYPKSHPNVIRSSNALQLDAFPVDLVQDVSQTLSHLTLAEGAGTMTSLDALGHDIFIFLAVSVVVVPLCKTLKLSPVLGFLIVGCLIGPYGLQIFSNSEADLELGDFGILFLLFNEGLTLSPDRIKELGRFTGLGVFQLLISIGLFFVGTFWGGPVILRLVQEMGIPLDVRLLKPVVDNPVESFCVAAAGALSSSAFVLPVLKQKKWEDRPEGIAGLSILLLQDLAVAPLLVILPLLAGSGPSTSIDLGILVTKATVGFGALLVAGSYVLRYVFDVVAATRSTETFVAAALLVALGMGQAADYLGLSATTGAFAAGVLLAGNRYRAQIKADIKPFEGILLGVFFITAGAELDLPFIASEWLTLVLGIAAFIIVKASIIFTSGPALGLTAGQAARVAITLSGGGEFALVLFSLAQSLGILPATLSKLLIASVILSMALTPLLGNVASTVGTLIESQSSDVGQDGLTKSEEIDLFDKIDADGSGSIDLEELREALTKLGFPIVSIAEVFASFDQKGDGLISKAEWKEGIDAGLLADALNANSKDPLNKNDVEFDEDAVVICGYGEVGQAMYKTLAAVESSKASSGGVACFDTNPSRVTSGVMAGVPIVFGDAAKIDLLKAAGVMKPRVVIVTFASDSRKIDATMRLRASLPDNTPIYVYEGKSKIGRQLFEAGATEVICETTETVLRFGSLLGLYSSQQEQDRLRTISFQQIGMEGSAGNGAVIKKFSEDAMIDLAEELNCSQREIAKLWDDFQSISEDRDEIPIDELKDMVMRLAGDGPSDGEGLEVFLKLEDDDGSGKLTFLEFAKAYFFDCARKEKRKKSSA